MALDSYALFTLDALKTWCRVPLGDATQDATLTTIGNAASALVERMAGRAFVTRTYTNEEYDGTGKATLFLREWPVSSVTSVDVRPDASEAWETLTATDYVADSRTGRLSRLLGGTWPLGVSTVRVTYAAGVAQGSLPYDLVEAGLEVAKAMYDRWRNGGISLTSVEVGPNTLTFLPEIPRDTRKAILRHRRVRV